MTHGDRRSRPSRRCGGEQKSLGKDVARAQGPEKQALLARTRDLSIEVKSADAAASEAAAELDRLLAALPNLVDGAAPVGGEEDYVVLTEHGTPRDFAAEGFEPRDHVELGRMLRRHRHRARRQGVRVAVLLPDRGGRAARAGPGQPRDGLRRRARPDAGHPALAGQARRDGGDGVPGPGRRERLSPRVRRPLSRRDLRGAARGDAHGRDPRRRRCCRCATRGTRRAFAARPARTARTPAASSGCTGSTRWRCSPSSPPEDAAAEHQRLLEWEKEFLTSLELPFRVIDVASGDLGCQRDAQVRLRGVDPLARALPRADLGVELHRVPGPAAGHPDARAHAAQGRSPRSTARCAR